MLKEMFCMMNLFRRVPKPHFLGKTPVEMFCMMNLFRRVPKPHFLGDRPIIWFMDDIYITLL